MAGVASDRVVHKVAAIQHFGHGPLAKLAAVEMRGVWLRQSFGSECLRGKHGKVPSTQADAALTDVQHLLVAVWVVDQL